MFNDPTIVHTVADLRRESLLAEAASSSRTTPGSGPGKRPIQFVRRLGATLAAAISRVVDDFEPTAQFRSSEMEPRRRPAQTRT